MAWTDENARRSELQRFAMKVLARPNKCAAVVDILYKAASLVLQLPSPAKTMMMDLKAVMIGEGYLNGERNVGKYAVFTKAKEEKSVKSLLGACGFQTAMQDENFQVQHAFAGLLLSYEYGPPAEWAAKYLEKEAQDLKLYDATFPIGRNLSDSNYMDAADAFKTAVCLDNAGNCLLSATTAA
jgi:hypothetical protein